MKQLRRTSIYTDETKRRLFFQPIYKAVHDIMPGLTSLRVLKLSKWKLTADLLGQLPFLTRLHTLEVRFCISQVSFSAASVGAQSNPGSFRYSSLLIVGRPLHVS